MIGDAMDRECDIQLGIERHRAGLLDGAEAVYRAILHREPNNGSVLNLLSAVERQRGKYHTAIELGRMAVASAPTSAQFHLNLGESLRAAAEYQEAVAVYQRSISIAEGDYRAHHALSQAFAALGDIPSAVSSAKRAISLMPGRRELYLCLAALLMRSHLYKDAAVVCDAAIGLWPQFHQFYGRLGAVRAAQGRWGEAVTNFSAALRRKTDWSDAHAGLAQALNHTGNCVAAEQSARDALKIEADLPRACVELGIALEHQGKVAAAIDPLAKAALLRPEDTEALLSLGGAMLQQLDQTQGIAHLRRAIATNPALSQVHSNLLLALNYPASADEQELSAEHRRWAGLHGANDCRQPKDHGRKVTDRLRIGYVSPDFRTHPIHYFFAPILQAHDRSRIVPVIFSDVVRPDGATTSLRSLGDEWHDTAHLDTNHFCEVVRAAKVDVLVDLAGHTANNRLCAFARGLAPVQITYLGYPNTTGLPRNIMQYRLTDAVCDPPGATDNLHTESLYRLPETFLCYRPPDEHNVPFVHSANRDCVTFGSFNGMQKVTSYMLDIWCEILHRVPCSRLVIKNRCMIDEGVRQRILSIAAGNGIDPHRMVFIGYEAAAAAHLARFAEIDIALDTFPYNGTTTTCEALWMGVPVVTLAGDVHRSRVGASLLNAVGLRHLIAQSDEEYAEIATSLANEGARSARDRADLRGRLVTSPFMDANTRALALENAYLDMYQTITTDNQ